MGRPHSADMVQQERELQQALSTSEKLMTSYPAQFLEDKALAEELGVPVVDVIYRRVQSYAEALRTTRASLHQVMVNTGQYGDRY